MISRQVTNLAASVRVRLRDVALNTRQEFGLTLTRYGIERLLYRLTQTEHAKRFVLKGAMLFVVWNKSSIRPTRDLDLLAFGESSAESMHKVFDDACNAHVEADALIFDAKTIRISTIREGGEYGGLRVHLRATLSNVQIPLKIDIGFGDVVTPAPEVVAYPTLLNFPAPRLCVYPKESVVAEKLHALVQLGITNSRMNDFYDLWMLPRLFAFDGQWLARAICATFERRRRVLPTDTPVGLTDAFGRSPEKTVMWRGYLRQARLTAPDLERTTAAIAGFLMPVLHALGGDQDFDGTWPPSGPWEEQSQATQHNV